MKTSFSLSLSTVAFLFSCHQGGGSVVGNGLIRFHNELYDYSFDYSSVLKLSNMNSELVVVDNSSNVGYKVSHPSRIEFEVASVNNMTLERLLPYALDKAPSANWQPLTVTGVAGFFYKDATEAYVKGEYLFLLGESAVLDVRMDAASEAAGFSLISPIIDTLVFDTKSPTIHEVVFDPPTIKAGESAKFKIRVSDNLSGVRGKDPYGNVFADIEIKCRDLMSTTSGHSTSTCGDFHSTGGGWYELDVPTTSGLPSGDYLLTPITIWDGAGNIRFLQVDSSDRTYFSIYGDPQKNIPLAFLKVENDHPDLTPPKVTDARFEPNRFHAGEASKLIFRVTDDDPAFVLKNFCKNAILEFSDYYKRSDVPHWGDADLSYNIHVCGEPKKRDDGAWEIPFETQKYSRPGIYKLWLYVKDAVNNSSETVTISFALANDDLVDLEGPKVLDVKATKAEMHPGETGSVLLKITDNLSGVAWDSPPYSTCNDGFQPFNEDENDRNAQRRVPLCGSQFHHLEGDWYAIDFKLGEGIPTGDYWLPSFSVQDLVGNRTFVDRMYHEGGKHTYYESMQRRDTDVPTVKIRVVR